MLTDPSSLKNGEANPTWQHVDRACALLWRQKKIKEEQPAISPLLK